MKNAPVEESNIFHCDNCNAELPSGANFCSVCGVSLKKATEVENAPISTLYCDHCSAELPSGASFCRVCGVSFKRAAKVENAATSAFHCNRCDAEIPAEAIFCSFCGANLEIAAKVEDAATSTMYCDNCDAELPSGAIFCRVCGVSFKKAAEVEHATVDTGVEGEDEATSHLDALVVHPVRRMWSHIFHRLRTLPDELEPEIEVPNRADKAKVKVDTVDSRWTWAIHPVRWVKHNVTTARMILVICAVGLLTLFVHGYHLSTAPDIFSDEGVYLLVGSDIARGLGLTVDNSTFLWHPPGYMLIEAAYLKLTGLVNADTLTAVLGARYLNVFFSACTAVVLVLFGRKLHSYKAGLFTAALFLMDPYVQRINRRNMLETLAMLCILLGLYIFFTRRSHLMKWQRCIAGIIFGVALLTKEPMFLELLALVIYVLLFRRHQLRDVIWVATIATSIYLLYPLWTIISGQWNGYLSYKLFGISRITALVTSHQPAPASGNITLVVATRSYLLTSLLDRLVQYGTSYLLIAFAAFFTCLLVFRYRHLLAARYLIVWSVFSFGFGLVLGKVSDQYFYYLIVPSIVVSGYILAIFFEMGLLPFVKKVLKKKVLKKAMAERALISRKDYARPSLLSAAYRMMWKPILVFFCLMLLYNSFVWARTYAFGSDDAYMDIVRYVEANIPRGTMIETSDDVAVYYLSSSYVTLLDRDTQTIIDRHARYFIMSSKDAEGGLDDMTPQLYNWVIANSYPMLEETDLSFGKLGLYELTTGAVLNNGMPVKQQTDSGKMHLLTQHVDGLSASLFSKRTCGLLSTKAFREAYIT